ncbi:TMV resistance protein N [Morella rubra]|uniref:ADP-ribosyl cyclase/cyclic ADP-ribose hydrolase n=1 Tax=Morella rubra TaxID=262757 RepID=A0A6A1WJP5_9ROSI|nr:TMV resistance protein N [Morella rubra]
MAAQTLVSSSKLHWNHDVFISFRGEETCKNFTDHLYSALVQVGVRTLWDDEELQSWVSRKRVGRTSKRVSTF